VISLLFDIHVIVLFSRIDSVCFYVSQMASAGSATAVERTNEKEKQKPTVAKKAQDEDEWPATREEDWKISIEKHVRAHTFSGKAFNSLMECLDGFDVRAETLKTLNTFLTSALKLENRYLTASQAYTLYSGFKMQPAMKWRVEHVLCSRVFDAWLISRQLMSVGWCYYATERPTNIWSAPTARMDGPPSYSAALSLDDD